MGTIINISSRFFLSFILTLIKTLRTMSGFSVGEEPYNFHFSYLLSFLVRFTVLVLLFTSLVCLLCQFM